MVKYQNAQSFKMDHNRLFSLQLYVYDIVTTNCEEKNTMKGLFVDPVSVTLVEQVLPDRDGKRCMFCLKTLSKTYEMSASDTKQRQEWTTGQKRQRR